MISPNFTTAFAVARTADEAANAIKNPRGWWSQAIEGPTEKPGDEFTYRYRDVHRCNIKVVEVVAQKKIVWQVLDNYFSFTEDKTEWKGTKLIFEIAGKGDQTEVRFTHEGLVPDYECYGMCSNAWGTYINGSLRRLITTGKGSPNPKEE
ncbi:MAG TPA: SRPBCC domain-containing protein [Steroidobacteraceae bacterium]|nr:SRPBCC domain-containing protein [Steroidobacteraceae bacterium]